MTVTHCYVKIGNMRLQSFPAASGRHHRLFCQSMCMRGNTLILLTGKALYRRNRATQAASSSFSKGRSRRAEISLILCTVLCHGQVCLNPNSPSLAALSSHLSSVHYPLSVCTWRRMLFSAL